MFIGLFSVFDSLEISIFFPEVNQIENKEQKYSVPLAICIYKFQGTLQSIPFKSLL